MLSVAVMVASFSFQIAGAIILLLWSLKKCDQTIKESCINDEPNWIELDGSGKTYTTLSKSELQQKAKIVYLNIAAFIDIIIGYACAIFLEDVNLYKWVILLLVIVLTAVIVIVEKLIVSIIARFKYSNDIQYETQ